MLFQFISEGPQRAPHDLPIALGPSAGEAPLKIMKYCSELAKINTLCTPSSPQGDLKERNTLPKARKNHKILHSGQSSERQHR